MDRKKHHLHCSARQEDFVVEYWTMKKGREVLEQDKNP